MKTKKKNETKPKSKNSVLERRSPSLNSSDSESSPKKKDVSQKLTKLKDKTPTRTDSHPSKSSDSEQSHMHGRSPRKVTPSPKCKKGDTNASERAKLNTSSSAVRQLKSHEMSSGSDEETETKSSKHGMSPRKQRIPQNSDMESSFAESDIIPETVSVHKSPGVTKTKIGEQIAAKIRSSGKRKSLQTSSKSNVLTSDSENEDLDTSVKSASKSSGESRSKRSLEANGKDSGVKFNTSDATGIHTLEGDMGDYQLCLMKIPADLPETSFPEVIMLNGIQDFSRKKRNYEIMSFPDAVLKRDFMTLLHSDSKTLKQGPRLQGQTQVITKPSQAFQAVSTPMITHKPVPFPTGLKVRFTPFGADSPDVKDISSHRKKHKKRKSSDDLHRTLSITEETDGSPKKKKKKKKHKHSSE